MTAGLVLVAAGRSTRMQGLDKLLIPLCGRPAIAWVLDALAATPGLAELVIVVNTENQEAIHKHVNEAHLSIPVTLCLGGEIRAASVHAGVRHLSPTIEFVLIHDAARPLVTPALFIQAMQAATVYGAVLPVVPVHDTIKQVDPQGRVMATLPRHQLVAAQTPQCFRRDWLEAAYARVPLDSPGITDEAALLEKAGFPVQTIPGSPENLKLTTPVDLATAEAILRLRQKGQQCSA